jgi:tight adherence protein B
MEKALSNMVKRVGGDDTVLMVSAINIQKQTGGNLSDILQTISETIKERQTLKKDIRVLTATGRISGMIIGMLPIGIGLMLLLINPDYIMSFFNTEIGIFMLIAAAALEIIGFLFVKKIVTVKF